MVVIYRRMARSPLTKPVWLATVNKAFSATSRIAIDYPAFRQYQSPPPTPAVVQNLPHQPVPSTIHLLPPHSH